MQIREVILNELKENEAVDYATLERVCAMKINDFNWRVFAVVINDMEDSGEIEYDHEYLCYTLPEKKG